jgi:hypothetical protein
VDLDQGLDVPILLQLSQRLYELVRYLFRHGVHLSCGFCFRVRVVLTRRSGL